MLDGSFWRLTILTLVLLAPAAFGAPPATNLETATSLGGQDVTDVAIDPSGQYVTGVVTVDPTKTIALPGQPPHKDVYACDYGPTTSRLSGTGCLTGEQPLGTPAGAQVVAFGAGTAQQQWYAVGGPTNGVGLWTTTQSGAAWRSNTSAGSTVVGLAVTANVSRVFAIASGAGNTGTVEVFGGQGATNNHIPEIFWRWSDARPVSIDIARSGGRIVVGTTNGVYFLHADMAKPTAVGQLQQQEPGGPVREVRISGDGGAVVAATTTGVYFLRLNASGPVLPAWSRNLPEGASNVALTLDGTSYAAASGSKIHFYRATNNTFIAETLGEAYDAGSPILDLDYDASGKVLVAITANRVLGFGPGDQKPMWSFDPTEAARGGLDTPLKRVLVSDDALRVVVAGKTKMMPYRNVISASASFRDTPLRDVLPGLSHRFELTVTNTGSLPDNYTFIGHFPVGWTGFVPQAIQLLPDRTATVNITLEVPQGREPGVYGFDVAIRSQRLTEAGIANAFVAGPAFNFTIPRAVVLNVTTAEERIPPLRQGGEQVVPVTVRNRGNAEGVVNMTTEQRLTRGSSWPLRFDREREVRVPAGGEVTVNLIITASADATSGDRNDITILAKEGQGSTAVVASRHVTIYVDPRFGAELSSRNSSLEFGPGELRTLQVQIVNTGNTEDKFNISATVTPASVSNDWRVTVDKENITIPRGETRTLIVSVRPGASEPRDASLVLRAVSNGSGESETAALTISLIARPPTVTPTAFLPAPALALVLPALLLAALAHRAVRGGRP